MAKNLNLAKAVYCTLAYADIFDYPLRQEEIQEWLISEKTVLMLPQNFTQVLKKLLAQKIIGRKGKYYYLKGRVDAVKTRQEREKWSKSKIKLAENIAVILRKIPWIKLVGLSGGLARNNADKEDDIDFFFICSSRRLFLARVIIIFILKILGKYRNPKKITDMICPNMFLAEDDMHILPEDLFIAHEICLLKPLVNKEQAYERFLAANQWVSRFLPNRYSKIAGEPKTFLLKKSVGFLFFPFFDLLEMMAKKFQLWYMRPKRTTEIVKDNLIKFHPQDTRKQIIAEYQKRVKAFLP